MKSWYPILAAVLVGAVALSLAYAASADKPVVGEKPDPVGDSQSGEVEDDVFGVYHPDRPRPGPPDRDTIRATRIVLEGPDVMIVLDANPRTGPPGITMTSRASGQSVVLYLAPADRARGTPARAVVGTRDRGMPNLGAALFSSGNAGYLQIRDRAGADVMPLHELKPRR